MLTETGIRNETSAKIDRGTVQITEKKALDQNHVDTELTNRMNLPTAASRAWSFPPQLVSAPNRHGTCDDP